MFITKEQILDTIAKMSVTEVVELISMIEKKFDVSASISTTSTPISTEVVEEKTEFNVILTAVGANKISVIKTVRSAIGLGLKEAKDLVESAPVILKENVSKKDAEILIKALKETGASVELK